MQTLFKEMPSLKERDQRLIELYKASGRSLDDLPYTREFDHIVEQIQEYEPDWKPSDVFHRLLNMRKAALLPHLGRSPTPPTRISIQEEERLSDLLAIHAGTLGQRDRLPYTNEFQHVVELFNQHTGRNLTLHQAWRLAARVAK